MNTLFDKNKLTSALILNLLAILLFSCASEPFLYDKPGFDRGEQPNVTNPSAPVKVAPDYYYRQPTYPQQAMPSPYQQPVPYQQPQYYYPQQPQYYYPQQPAYYYPPVQAYNPYGNAGGGSRFYSNPYAIAPSNQYPNYDADQYYVPPASYNNIEPQQKAPSNPGP